MDSGVYFPFDRLPTEIQARILTLVPISTLALCKVVSRSWRSLISSPAFTDSYPRHRRDDLLFVLLADADYHSYGLAYLPSSDRWIRVSLPQIVHPLVSGTSLILANLVPNHTAILYPFYRHRKQAGIESNPIAVVNLFSRHRSPHPIPPTDPRSDALALIEHSPSDYKIVAVSTDYNQQTNIYHSRTGQWEPSGQLDRRFAVLFCLSDGPHHLLTFDPVGGQWTVLHLDMPSLSLVCPQIMVFGGELYLAAGVEEDEVIARICIWKLDRRGKEWKEVSCLPQAYLDLFGYRDNYFEIIDKEGMVCFYKQARDHYFVMCDLAVKRWWLPKPCDAPWDDMMSFGVAIEPHVHLLK